MKIDRNTRYEDFLVWEPFLAEGQAEAIEKVAVSDRYGKDGFFSMPLGDMFEVLAGNSKPLTWGVAPDSVFAVYRVRAFQKFIGNGKDGGFIAKLKSLTLPPSPDASQASKGCLTCAFDESVYVFCRNYFNLQGFEAVERLKVADLLLAKRDTYNQQVVDRNIAAAMRKGKKK